MDNILIASTQMEWIQEGFDALIGMFDRVGIKKHLGNIAGMLCRPYCTVKTQL